MLPVSQQVPGGHYGAGYWMVAFLGASTAFVESTALHRFTKNVMIKASLSVVQPIILKKSTRAKWCAVLFAVSAIAACGLCWWHRPIRFAGSDEQFTVIFSLMFSRGNCSVLGFIIGGGVKTLLPPLLSWLYLYGTCLYHRGDCYYHHAYRSITWCAGVNFRSFGMVRRFGAVLGLAIQWGVKRMAFTPYQTGQGTGPHRQPLRCHPTKQGLIWRNLVYVDTLYLFVRRRVSLLIIAVYMYNVQGPPTKKPDSKGLKGVSGRSGYVQTAMENIMPGFGAVFDGLIALFFAFTTIMALLCAETNIRYLTRTVKAKLGTQYSK